MLVNLNAVITIHCGTFFPPIISFESASLLDVCVRAHLCADTRANQSGPTAELMNARGEQGKEGGGRGTHSSSSSICDLLYLAIINIWSHISYPLCRAHY